MKTAEDVHSWCDI